MGYQNQTASIVDQGFKAGEAGNYDQMQRLLGQAIRAGRQDEGVLRGYAFALCRLQRYDEAVTVARDNYRLNPGAFSLAGVCETYASAGRYEEARQSLRLALRYEDEWGNAKPIFDASLEAVAPKLCTLIYEIDPSLTRQFTYLHKPDTAIICPLVSQDPPYQSSTFDVKGASESKEITIGDTKALRLLPEGDNPITVTYRVRLTPTNLRARLKPFTPEEVPENVRQYSKPTSGIECGSDIVMQTLAPLAGRNSTETIENIFQWATRNLKYDGSTHDSGGGTIAVLKRRSGHCEGQTSGVVGLLRAAGVPARFVRGHGAIAGSKGVPTMHSWTEIYVPSYGWLPWDLNNAAFTAPARICIGQFRYSSPFDAKDAFKQSSADLWNFQSLLFPPGTTHGKEGNAHFTLEVSRQL